MPVYKDKKNGKWYVMVRYKDWTGANKQKCQRGFETKIVSNDLTKRGGYYNENNQSKRL